MSRLLLFLVGLGSVSAQAAPDGFVRTWCVTCHGGDTVKGELDLTRPATSTTAVLWRWSRLGERVRAGEMPPSDADRPSPAERAAFVAAIEAKLRVEVPDLPADPGRVTVRRLNRTHFRHAIRDLFGVDVDTSGFPADDLGYGFDSIGDALSFSTLHLEQYLGAARAVAMEVFHGEDPARPTVRRVEAESMVVVAGHSVTQHADLAGLLTNATIEQTVRLPRDGNYRLRVHAGADQGGDELARFSLSIDGRELDSFEVAQRRPSSFLITTPLVGGERRVGVSFLNDFYQPENPDPARRDRNLHVDWVEIEGPIEARSVPPAQRWLTAATAAGANDEQRLSLLVGALWPRVYRRPVNEQELAPVLRAAAEHLRAGRPLVDALRLMLQAALVSPWFLFRIEAHDARPPGTIEPLSGPALATRLSFFLWASTPDERLLELAAEGRLAEPAVFLAEVDRLLEDPRAESLATDFAAQWLELGNLRDRTPDPARFPAFDDRLRRSMQRETELLFLAVLREGRDVRTLLDCDFTHVDAALAGLYGLPVPADPDAFVRVSLPPAWRERGGVLGHASVLTVTSNPTRTSPVKRGKWMLENLLGQGPPPPPPGNDSLADEGAIDSSRSFRAQLAQHRERSACAVCHVRMDALGFALERYDAIGRHRERDAGGVIDCSGELPDGTRIGGLSDLKRVLIADRAFVQSLARRLFVYAVGRDLRPVDRLRLDLAVARRLDAGRVTLRDLVRLVVEDDAFRRRVAEP